MMEFRKPPMDRPRRRKLLLVAAAIALAACRIGERAQQAESAEPAPASAPADPAPTPEPVALPESSATIEVTIPQPDIAPTAEPAFLTEPPRPPDDPERCLTLDARPSSVSAYGVSGPAAQLIVRARNACSTGFPGPRVYFRAVAVSMEGSELASATGQFSGEIRPYATAETLVAIETDLTRVRSWRVELR
jgi:hypothetical protein